jgi:hypothetical protein
MCICVKDLIYLTQHTQFDGTYVIQNVGTGWYMYQSAATIVSLKSTISSPPTGFEKWYITSTNIVPN